jgi:ApaG protein
MDQSEDGDEDGHEHEHDDELAYEARTNDILVRVRAFFLEDESEPEEGRFVWAYRVAVENHGRFTVQLLRRSWVITDATGRTERVHGEGVVGEQPVLAPGQAFEYVSGTPLPTPSGFMTGAYHLVEKASGTAFDVAIPVFSLDSPHADGRVH